jgi:hypothetical protein
MNLAVAEFVLLGQGPDGEESSWMQLLVFVILAVFWAIGGIMKARAAKSQEEKQKQQTPPRPPRQRPSLERILDAQPEKARTRPMQAKAVKMARKPVPEKVFGLQVEEIAAVQAADHAPSRPKVSAKKKAPLAEEKAEAAIMTLEEPQIQIGTTDQLRAAIIHYEIFGKCIALRGSQEQIWIR